MEGVMPDEDEVLSGYSIQIVSSWMAVLF
jgi:hypothetical protein